MTARLVARIAGRTDRGAIRGENQDVVLIDGWASGADRADHVATAELTTARTTVAVIDGMGGHRGGGLAAWVAAHALERGLGDVSDGAAADRLAEDAHRLVSSAGEGVGLPEMGAAFAALVLSSDGFGVLNIGDCRVHRLSEARLGLLSVDDSGPSRHDPTRLVLTQSLGGGGDSRLDAHWFWSTWGVVRSQRFVLASDGLAVLEEGAIARIARDGDARGAASALVAATLEAGSPDNVSVVVVDVVRETL